MAIKRIDNNKYRITIELGTDILGKRKRKKETFYGTKQEAVLRDAELHKKYYHIGKKIDVNDITFENYSQIYIKKYCIPNVAAVTLMSYERLLRDINRIIGKRKLKDISSFILDDMYAKLKYGQNGKELSYYSQYDYYKLVRAMFRRALKWDLIEKDPTIGVSNKPKKIIKEISCYDFNEVNELVKALDNECIKYRALILLVLDSSIRRSEALALRWNDIDWDNKTINITKSLKVIKGKVDEKTTKSEYSKRKIVISDSTINVLKEYKEWQNEQIRLLGKKYKDENRVFTATDGTYMNPSMCGHILKKVIKRHNLSNLSFHGLRHTGASILINSGVNAKTVSERLGHSDASITMKVYIHSYDSSENQCANVMDEMFKKNIKMA